jgi:FkbM family methyltransferase
LLDCGGDRHAGGHSLICKFEYNGEVHEVMTPDNPVWRTMVGEIIEGKSYPFYDNMNPKTVLDLGANIGIFSLMACIVWPDCSVVAYEPEPNNCSIWRHNLEKYEDRATLIQKAVDLVDCEGKLWESRYGSMAYSLIKQEHHDDAYQTVQVASASRLPACELVKLDIEGMELPVIRNMDLSKTKWIYAEFHSESDRIDIDRYLAVGHGFKNEPTDFMLRYARISRAECGEVMYQRRDGR